MKPIVWIVLIAVILFLVIGFNILAYSKQRRPVDGYTEMFITMLAMVVGAVAGFAFFMPCYCLLCLIAPNKPVNGQIIMPLGQYLGGMLMAVILGFITVIIAYIKILKWRKL